MVPFTLCAFTVGLDLVNQSLSTLTAAPMAMTAIQAGFMSAATMLWTVGCHVYMLIARRGNGAHGAPPALVKSRSGERSPSRVPSELTLHLDAGNAGHAGQLTTFSCSFNMWCPLKFESESLIHYPLRNPTEVPSVLHHADKVALWVDACGSVVCGLPAHQP